MKSYRKELWFNIPARRAFVNVTPQVEECLRDSGITEGIALINAMHITSSVFINDDEQGLHQDYDDWLEKLAPHEPVSQYRHNRTGEDNGMHTSSGRSWEGRSSLRLQTADSISAPGNKFFTENLTAGEGNGLL